jgi:hypothetical protein
MCKYQQLSGIPSEVYLSSECGVWFGKAMGNPCMLEVFDARDSDFEISKLFSSSHVINWHTLSLTTDPQPLPPSHHFQPSS